MAPALFTIGADSMNLEICMLITATNKPLRVDFKINGKFYGKPTEGETAPAINTDTESEFPFDSVELKPGENFNKTDVSVLRVVELGDNAGPDESPVAP